MEFNIHTVGLIVAMLVSIVTASIRIIESEKTIGMITRAIAKSSFITRNWPCWLVCFFGVAAWYWVVTSPVTALSVVVASAGSVMISFGMLSALFMEMLFRTVDRLLPFAYQDCAADERKD